MHLARAGLTLPVLTLLVLSAACRPAIDTLWRDQYVFLGDDGSVLVVGLDRRGTGFGEAKAWFGEKGRWRSTYHHRFPLAPSHVSDVSKALAALSLSDGAHAKASLESAGDTAFSLRLRTASASVELRARDLLLLGEMKDPEGTTRYRAGPATLRFDGAARAGWATTEETPPGTGRPSFVEYGDFAFVILGDGAGGVVAVKRSLRIPGFDHAVVRGGDGVVAATRPVVVGIGGGRLSVDLPELGQTFQASVLDTRSGEGEAPGGGAVTYETMLLGGDATGVAFTIRPTGAEEAK